WEWHYLDRRCRAGCLVFPGFLKPPRGTPPLLFCSSDGQLLVTVVPDPASPSPLPTENVLPVCDARSGARLPARPSPCHLNGVARQVPGALRGVAWQAVRGGLAVRDLIGVVRVKDVRTGNGMAQFQAAGPQLLGLAFHADGRLLAIGTETGREQSQVKVWDIGK